MLNLKVWDMDLLLSKRALPKAKTDYLQTFIQLTFIKLIGKRGLKDGGLAQILNV